MRESAGSPREQRRTTGLTWGTIGTALLVVTLLLAVRASATVSSVEIEPSTVEPGQRTQATARGNLVDEVAFVFRHGGTEHTLRREVPPGAPNASVTWDVPDSSPRGSWTLEARDGSDAGRAQGASTAFTIANRPPRLVDANSPSIGNGTGLAWAEARLRLTANATDHTPPLTASVTLNGGNHSHVLRVPRVNAGPPTRFALDEPVRSSSLPPGTYTATLTVSDGEGAKTTHVFEDGVLRIVEHEPPSLTWREPAPGTWEAGTRLPVAVEATDPVSIATVRALLSSPGGDGDRTWALEPATTGARGGIHRGTSQAPVDEPGTWRLTVEAIDAAGNAARITREVRVVDERPPTITRIETSARTTDPPRIETGQSWLVSAAVEDAQPVEAWVEVVPPDGTTARHPLGESHGDRWQASIPVDEPGRYRWRLAATDDGGNLANTSEHTLVAVEDLAPRIEPLDPPPGGTVAATNGRLTAQVLDPSLDPGTIRLRVATDRPPDLVDPVPDERLDVAAVEGGRELTYEVDAPAGTVLRVHLVAEDAGGRASSARWNVTVDGQPPSLDVRVDGRDPPPGERLPVSPERSRLTVEARDETVPPEALTLRARLLRAGESVPEPDWHAIDPAQALQTLADDWPSGPATLEVQAADPTNHTTRSAVAVLVDGTPPALDHSFEGQRVLVAAADPGSGVDGARLHVLEGNEVEAQPMERVGAGVYGADVPVESRGTLTRLWLTAEDQAGNVASVGSRLAPLVFEQPDHAPRVNVTSQPPDSRDADVTWTVTDPDGDAVRVAVAWTDGNGRILSTLDRRAPANGSLTLEDETPPREATHLAVEATGGNQSTVGTLPLSQIHATAETPPHSVDAPGFLAALATTLATAGGLARVWRHARDA